MTEEPLGPGESRNVLTPILRGLLASHYLLAMRFPLTIELELVANSYQVCARGPNVQGNAGLAPVYPFARLSRLTNGRILADTAQCDSVINEQLSQALLEGRPLPLHFSSYNNTMHVIDAAGGAWSAQLGRAFSRIKTIFANLVSTTASATSTPRATPSSRGTSSPTSTSTAPRTSTRQASTISGRSCRSARSSGRISS